MAYIEGFHTQPGTHTFPRSPSIDGMELRLLIAAAGVLLLARLCLFLVRHLRSPLKPVPGPFLARITNAWYFWAVKRGDFEVVNVELHKKHGGCCLVSDCHAILA